MRKRDRGVCSECHLDTYRLRAKIIRLAQLSPLRFMSFMSRHRLKWWKDYRWAGTTFDDFPSVTIKSLWEADHILQVAEGGGACGLDNLRTLCIFCHRKATAAYAALRAQRRKVGASRQQPNNERALS